MKSAPPVYMSVSLVFPLEVKSLPMVEQMVIHSNALCWKELLLLQVALNILDH